MASKIPKSCHPITVYAIKVNIFQMKTDAKYRLFFSKDCMQVDNIVICQRRENEL